MHFLLAVLFLNLQNLLRRGKYGLQLSSIFFPLFNFCNAYYADLTIRVMKEPCWNECSMLSKYEFNSFCHTTCTTHYKIYPLTSLF